jgi:hypothetical protein
MKESIKKKILTDYPNVDTKEIVKKYNVTISQIYNLTHYHNVKKSQEYLDNWKLSGRGRMIHHGKKHRYTKGSTPFNKGRKMAEYVSQESIDKIQKTTFKKGNLPHNTLSDGAVTLRRDKTGVSYYYYRISKAKWMPYHHKLWIDVHGEIPKGYIVVFKDRNTLNCKIENLELITRQENMQRNSIQRYPNEIRQTIKTLTKLKKTINGKEQN